MSDKPSYEELQARLAQAEAALEALRRGQVDLVVGEQGPLVVQLKSLTEERERLIRLVEAMTEIAPTLIVVADRQGRIVRFNRACQALSGYAAAEALGRDIVELLVPAAWRAAAEAHFADPSDRMLREPFVLPWRTRAGEERLVEWRCARIAAPEGGGQYLVCVGLDITERKRAEDALRESERRYAALVQASPAGIFHTDAEGKTTYVSPRWCEISGLSEAAALGDGWLAAVHPADRPMLAAGWQEAAVAGRPSTAEYRFVRPDGSVRWVMGQAVPQTDADGRVVGYVGAITDITERKCAEQALLESEQRFRRLAENAQDLIYRYEFTPKRGFTYVSPAATAITGYTPEDHYADPDLGLKIVHPDDRPLLEQYFQNGGVFGAPIVLRWQKKDGTVIWTEQRNVAVRNEAGEVIAIEGIARDITERKLAEDALRESETRNRIIADLISDYAYIFRVTAEGELRGEWVTESFTKVFGLTRAEIDARGGWQSLVLPEDLPLARRHARKVAGGESDVCEMRWVTAGGEVRWLRDYAQPVFDETGTRVVRIYGAAQDITERKRAEEQLRATLADLERSNADLEHFAYAASHDLQEPLRMVASFVQLLAERYRGRLDADADEFIGYVVDGVKRMQQLILDLLEYSRVSTRGAPLRPTDANLACRTALRDLELAITESGATVICDPLPVVLADATQLTRVFQNLIGNAIKFRGAEPPRIRIWAEQRPGPNLRPEWVFAVQDNGIGIEPEYFERIFIIFQRLHSPRQYPGTGIGLAVCKRIVERHGGRIWVESTPGQGSTFYFTLPA